MIKARKFFCQLFLGLTLFSVFPLYSITVLADDSTDSTAVDQTESQPKEQQDESNAGQNQSSEGQ